MAPQLVDTCERSFGPEVLRIRHVLLMMLLSLGTAVSHDPRILPDFRPGFYNISHDFRPVNRRNEQQISLLSSGALTLLSLQSKHLCLARSHGRARAGWPGADCRARP